MKKSILIVLALAVGCAGLAFGQTKAKDGVYFAQQDKFSSIGWREQVVVTVKAGKIAGVVWNGVSNTGVADRLSVLPAGYDMVKYGKAKAAWDAQAKAVQDYLLAKQDPAFGSYKDAAGHTDAIAGATMNVKVFFDLANQALASAPVPKGIYAKDGWYFAQQNAFDKETGWKDSALATVVNGSVVDVVWNGTYKDATKKSKIVESEAGKYGMEKAAKKGPWHVQAKLVEAAIVKAQDPAKIAIKADGTTDAIAGASLHPIAVGLVAEALKAAK